MGPKEVPPVLGNKLDASRNPQGRSWLYSWLRDPTNYHVRTKMPDTFLEPIEVGDYPAEAAGDRATVQAISAKVRACMEAAFAEMLERRKSIWWAPQPPNSTPWQ